MESKLSATTSDNSEIWETPLTDDELKAAIFNAKCAKHFADKDRQRNETFIKNAMEARRAWSYDELRQHAITVAHTLAQRTCKRFVMDKCIEPLYDYLTLYFTSDPAFERKVKGWSLHKGLLLMGDPGLGKTDALLSFALNKRAPYKVITCEQIEQYIRTKGPTYLSTFIGEVPGAGRTIDTFYLPMCWAFDDLGRENPVYNYDLLPKLIHEIYLLKKTVGIKTIPHLCTNFNWQMLEARYDYTVTSRLKEMYNVIEVKGTDRRENS